MPAHLPIMPEWRPHLNPASGDGDLTWAYPWPAGERLAADLAEVVDCRGLRIAELGCGRGRSGLTALLLGAANVLFADLEEAPLAYVSRALAVNAVAERGHVARHAWGEPLPGGPFDLLIGADILYRPLFHEALLRSIASSLAPNGHCLLADPRTELETELPEIAATFGLSWHIRRRPLNYTLVTLAWS
jgi:predicted nicotinamide N-methyase